VLVQVDRRLKPVGLDNQQITGEVFERALRRGADKQPFPPIASDGTHDDDVSLELLRYQRQFLVRQAGDQVRMRLADLVKLRNFGKALLVILVHLLLDFVERQGHGDIRVGRCGRDRDTRIVGMERVNVAADIIGKYMDIRGYGPVKEQSVQEVREQVDAAKKSMLAESRAAA